MPPSVFDSSSSPKLKLQIPKPPNTCNSEREACHPEQDYYNRKVPPGLKVRARSSVSMYVCMYVCMYIYIYIVVYLFVCLLTYFLLIYIYIFIYLFIYIHAYV